ncbi:glycoside hydrolase family 16 protein [Nonomuraea sp. NPDC026600]|uniref:glycoside hydrolase family 16 protein n=1 Tax=Nonomuraea sp. NPDC026600 TaxID=3155363 RepID=UPI0033EE70A5
MKTEKVGYELEFENSFEAGAWIPHHLPHWSSRAASAARYETGGGLLRLQITEDQPPWCPEFDGQTRVSSMQTGVFAGPVGSPVGQHRFNPQAVVREEQHNTRGYTPQYGLFELRAKVSDDPNTMAALWMIGYEDQPDRSAEICVCEIFGRDVGPDSVKIGMGVHPFSDPRIAEEFSAETLPLDAGQFHVYAAEWTPEQVTFFVDGRPVKTVRQSPNYPMQFMLGIYEFRDETGAPSGRYPKEFTIDYFRAYRARGSRQ